MQRDSAHKRRQGPQVCVGTGSSSAPLAAPRVSSRGSSAHRLETRPLAATVVLPTPALHFWLILPASVTPLGWFWFGAWSPDGPHPGSVGPVSAPRPSLPCEDAPCPRLDTDWSQILMLPENTEFQGLTALEPVYWGAFKEMGQNVEGI